MIAGSGKSILRYVTIRLAGFHLSDIFNKLCDHLRRKTFDRRQTMLCGLFLFRL